jgi:uronate dehydrogenase
VRGFDRRAAPELTELEDLVIGDLQDRQVVRRALQGVDSVVHLAAVPDEADFAILEGPNVRGLFHVFDAARLEGVQRVTLASSIQVLGKWWDRGRSRPASAEDADPSNHYALTKLWAEQMGQMYSRLYGLSVIAARVAFMVRDLDEALRLRQKELFDVYLSRGDVGRFFALAVEAGPIEFAVLYAAGVGGERMFDLEPARRLIGYEPRDRWPAGLGFALPE